MCALTGKHHQTQRDSDVARFQDEPCVRIALLSITTCCLGLTLTAASTIVFAGVVLRAEDHGASRRPVRIELVKQNLWTCTTWLPMALLMIGFWHHWQRNKWSCDRCWIQTRLMGHFLMGHFLLCVQVARPLAQNAAMRGKTNAPQVRTVRSPRFIRSSNCT